MLKLPTGAANESSPHLPVSRCFRRRSLPTGLPILVCGDLNGDSSSVVLRHLRRHGWEDTFATIKPEFPHWVSHMTHRGTAMGCDYILLQNPSRPRQVVIPWTDVVFSEIAGELQSRGFKTPEQAWDYFASVASLGGGVSAAGFAQALFSLGFGGGTGKPTLTAVEVDMLANSCDVDGNGFIDSIEWCTRFSEALRRLRYRGLVRDAPDCRADLKVVDAQIFPRCLEEGRWPQEADGGWDLSDHGVVVSTFEAATTCGCSADTGVSDEDSPPAIEEEEGASLDVFGELKMRSA